MQVVEFGNKYPNPDSKDPRINVISYKNLDDSNENSRAVYK